MMRMMMKSKLHRARVIEANLNYMGSLSVDRNLMEMADLHPHEKVQVVNVSTGARFETYVIPAEAGSGVIGVNGGAARLASVGDVILVISYALMDESEAASHRPKVFILDEQNRPVGPGNP